MKTRDQRGAAVVEFAVLSGLLLIFLVGIFEFGFLWLQANYIGNAAREGARVAAKIGGTDVAGRQQAAEQAVEAYLKSNFLFRDRGSCQPNDSDFPMSCDYAVADADFVTIPPPVERDEVVIVGGDTITLRMIEVTVTVKTHRIWEPMLWPLLSAILPGVDYDPNKLKTLTQTATYAIHG